MDHFPAISSGVLVSPVGDEFIAYDLVTEIAHRLNASAGLILGVCDGVTPMDQWVSELADQQDLDSESVAAQVSNALSSFESLGLIGRAGQFSRPRIFEQTRDPQPVDPLPLHVGATHRAIDYQVAFRGPDPELVHSVDAFLGTGSTKVPDPSPDPAPDSTTVFFDVSREEPSGEFVVKGDVEYRYSSRSEFLHRVTMVLNEQAVNSSSCVVLHSGGVRSTASHGGTGQIVLLPAHSGSGKSTLTGALIAAGWDYLSDEAVGVRRVGVRRVGVSRVGVRGVGVGAGALVAVGYPKPLSIDSESQRVLGLGPSELEDIDPSELRADVERLAGDVGPISRVILPVYRRGASTELEDLSVSDSLVELLANTLNLARVGQSGLDTLCELAERLPVQRLVHGDVRDAVAVISET